MSERFAEREAEARVPAIKQTFNIQGGATSKERGRHLRGAVDAAMTRGIKEAIEGLPRMPLPGGHAYLRQAAGPCVLSFWLLETDGKLVDEMTGVAHRLA